MSDGATCHYCRKSPCACDEPLKAANALYVEARDEIRAAIEWYDAREKCWLSVVTFIGIRALFGSWHELVSSLRPSWHHKRG